MTDPRIRRAAATPPGWFRRLVRGGAAAAALAVLGTVLQVGFVRFVDPPMTPTMLSRAWAAWRAGRPATVDQRPVRLGAVSLAARRAVLSSEDAKFYAHNGFDWESLGEAAAGYLDREDGEPLRGGSTISQQVAKNVFLWQERSWVRKVLEVWYTVWLELLVPKDRIFELYLNVAETGPMTFGVEAAAWRWYKVPASALTLQQGAEIASMLPSPIKRTPKSKVVQRHAAWIQRNLVELPK